MSHSFRVEVDPDVCVGTRLCNALAPDSLRYDADQGVSVAVAGPGSDERVLEAAESCPVGAIVVRRADTGERVDP